MLKKIIFIVMILLMSALVLAQVPQQINYQGYLTSNTGTPITTTTPLEMTFKLYSSPVIVAHLWEATYDVDVVEGRFNVLSGLPKKTLNLPSTTSTS